MDGLKNVLIYVSLLSLLSACVPVSKKTTCAEDESLDQLRRVCVPLSNLNPNNKAPISTNQGHTTNEDLAINFEIVSAIDPDGDALSYAIVTNPGHGTLTNCMNRAGSTGLDDRSCTYTPALNYHGADSFTYGVNDGQAESEATLIVSFTINPINDAPTVTASTTTTAEDTAKVITISYSDPEGELATACAVMTPVNLSLGSCACNAFGVCQVTVTPDLNENSSNQSFSFIARVGAGPLSSETTMTVVVTPVNDVPVLTSASGCNTILDQDTTFFCGGTPIVTDPDTSDTPAQTHQWSLAPTNTCSFAAINATSGAVSGSTTDDNVGTCNFIYQVKDNSSATNNTATGASIPVTVNNRLPVINVASTLTHALEDGGEQLLGRFSSDAVCAEVFCLSIDTFVFGTASIDLATSTCDENGTFRLQTVNSTNKEIYFTPNSDYHSDGNTCIVAVTFDDGNGGIASASGTIKINEVNDSPTITPASISSQSTNEATSFVVDTDTSTEAIDPLTVDEGGGVSEDSQTLSIKIQSSKTTLIPHNSATIQAFSDADFSTPYTFQSADASGVTFSNPDGNSNPVYIVLTPAVGEKGSALITVTITDDGKDTGVLTPRSSTKTLPVSVSNNSVNHNDWSDIYAVGARVHSDGTVEVEPIVRLEWNVFTVNSDSITGYWVYRSTSPDGPFLNPLHATPLTETTYEDTTLTDADADTTFYYKVSAVSSENGKVIDPSESYSVLKVPIPLHNMALLHRRIVNFRTCTSMGLSSSIDPENHNRCDYVGPGDNYSGKYDIDSDYFVDRYEASCNFTVDSSICTETGGVGCIGNGTPASVGVTTSGENAIYYNRETGTCYYYNGFSWKTLALLNKTEVLSFATLNQTINSTLDISGGAFPKKPPMVRIQQFKAHNYCKAFPDKTLISRQVHIAGAEWNPDIETEAGKTATLEAGAELSLTVSQCNASSGGVLNFQDGFISALFDTWTATESSASTSHSFVMSGSTVTQECQSLYGIQDLTGNVEEWTLDRFFYSNTTLLRPVGDNMGPLTNTFRPQMLDVTYNPYSFETSGGSETIAITNSIAPLADFVWGVLFSDLDHIHLPFGVATTGTANSVDITTPSFNEDSVSFISATVTVAEDNIIQDGELSGITAGGGFEDGTGAGRYSMKYRSVCDDSDNSGVCTASDIEATGTEENVSTGLRCMMKVP